MAQIMCKPVLSHGKLQDKRYFDKKDSNSWTNNGVSRKRQWIGNATIHQRIFFVSILLSGIFIFHDFLSNSVDAQLSPINQKSPIIFPFSLTCRNPVKKSTCRYGRNTWTY